MTRRIWKYKIGPHLRTFHEMPCGAIFRYIDLQDNEPHAWFEVDPDAPRVRCSFDIVLTGGNVEDWRGSYIGSVQTAEGYLLHVYYQEVAHVVSE